MKKVCKYRGCNQLINKKDIYCEEHKDEGIRDHNSYRIRRKDKEEQKFYKSKEWIRERDKAKERDIGLCQICLHNKRFTKSDVVHHIVEITEDEDGRLEQYNLISLCNSCHKLVHGSYKRGKVTKKETQNKLKEIINKGEGVYKNF